MLYKQVLIQLILYILFPNSNGNMTNQYFRDGFYAIQLEEKVAILSKNK